MENLVRTVSKLALLFCLLLSPLYSGALHAQTSGEVYIREIKVEGNQRVEADTISSFLSLSPNAKYTPDVIDEALKRVFATGLFSDVNIDIRGNDLVVKVVENPIVNEVAFEGNRRVKDDDLRPEMKLRERSVYTKNAVQEDVRRILDIYQKSSRFSTIVTPKVIMLDQNRVNLVYEIDEGAKTEIKRISFVGNKNYGGSKLRDVIQTRESRWYRILSSDDNYDADRMNFDQELLRRFYVSKGFADFRVTSAVAELTPERDGFLLTFTVDEGSKYTFGKMSVESQVPDLQASTLEGLLVSKDGETFNAQKVEETQEAMTKELGNLGYAFVDIDTQYNRDPVAKVIGLHYVVKEGPRVYVNNINIHGNVRTLDEVIRREFRVSEGDPYNASKIKRSQERISNLGFFKRADIKNMPSDEPDRVDIDVDVEEKSTGELTLGAGFSTGDGPLADIGISERNLLGRGQLLRANFTVSGVRQDIDFGFTEPYFLDRNLAAGVDLFKLKRTGNSSRANRAFDSDSLGFTLRASYPLTEHLTHAVRYTLRSDEITDIDPLASRFIKDQEGKTTASIIGHTFTYDTRDSRFDPTEGYFIRFSQDAAGLGADSKFIKNELKGGYYISTFSNKWILQFSGRGGKIFPFGGRDVEINNRFFIGGNEVRGFSNDGIGPRDSLTKDVLGGNTFYAGTAEYTFPLGLAEELGFSGAAFVDAGSLFDVDDNGPGVLDEASLRASVGVGLAWKSPLGPVRINVAHAFMKETFDETEILRFSFGTRF